MHGVAMVVFTAAALWEVQRGWRDDRFEPRRAARRWVALGIGGYAAVALVVELALRGRAVGAPLPALHVLGIGGIALAVLVARRSLDVILGVPREAAAAATDPTLSRSNSLHRDRRTSDLRHMLNISIFAAAMVTKPFLLFY